MLQKHLILALSIATSLTFASGEDKARVRVRNTQRIDFQPGGSVVVKNSIGELRLEGWDQPAVEITTIKSTKDDYGPEEHDQAVRKLDKVHVSAERHGGEILITTDYPLRLGPPPPLPWSHATSFDLEYDIKLPRGTRLTVEHKVGEVHVYNVLGGIRVTASQGEITVHLPEKGAYAIDAKSDFGSVISDFPGRGRSRPWVFGQKISPLASNASENLHLRIGYGDILVFGERIPPSRAPLAR